MAALGCAICYGVGSILEDISAKPAAARVGLGMKGVRAAMAQLPYLAGLGLDAVGWILSLLALQRLALFAVQAAVASSVAVTVILAAFVLHERISRRQLGALITLGVGLILLAASAAPDSAASISTATEVVLLVGVLVVGAAGLATMRLRGSNGAGTLGALSGLAFGGTMIRTPAPPTPSARPSARSCIPSMPRSPCR